MQEDAPCRRAAAGSLARDGRRVVGWARDVIRPLRASRVIGAAEGRRYSASVLGTVPGSIVTNWSDDGARRRLLIHQWSAHRFFQTWHARRVCRWSTTAIAIPAKLWVFSMISSFRVVKSQNLH